MTDQHKTKTIKSSAKFPAGQAQLLNQNYWENKTHMHGCHGKSSPEKLLGRNERNWFL